MADGLIQLPADSTGKKLDTSELTVGSNTVERQRVVVADPTNAANLATVNSNGSINVEDVNTVATGTTAPSQIGIVGGKTTDATPQYQPIPLTGAGAAVKVDGSAVTQPVSGTVTANQGSANATPWNMNQAQWTGKNPSFAAYQITTNTTNTVTASTAYVGFFLIQATSAGTSWTVKIQNKETPAKVLYSGTVTTSVTGLNISMPVLATNGIDIVTSGTTAGNVNVFISYWQ